jgi:X-Pro dipeptidyl-peptidase C-terminal non-catalytic domain
MWPTSMLFRRGHRIRIEVSSSNFPRYDRNTNTGNDIATDIAPIAVTQTRLLETEDYNQLAAGKDGYFLYNRNDQFIGRAIEKYGEFSGLEMDLLIQFCAPVGFMLF